MAALFNTFQMGIWSHRLDCQFIRTNAEKSLIEVYDLFAARQNSINDAEENDSNSSNIQSQESVQMSAFYAKDD